VMCASIVQALFKVPLEPSIPGVFRVSRSDVPVFVFKPPALFLAMFQVSHLAIYGTFKSASSTILSDGPSHSSAGVIPVMSCAQWLTE
jgi:hypothetical protein